MEVKIELQQDSRVAMQRILAMKLTVSHLQPRLREKNKHKRHKN